MCSKAAYRSSAAALAEMKKIIWRNSVEGDGEKSRGLNVYRCRCGAWHIGHAWKGKREKEEGKGAA